MAALTVTTQALTSATQDFETILESFAAYLDRRGRKQATIASYCGAIRKFWQFRQESGAAASSGQMVADWRDAMLADRLASKTVALYLAAMRIFAAWAVKAGFMKDEIAESIAEVGAGRIETTFRRDALSEAQARQLLQGIDTQTLNGRRDYALILTALSCGLRACEISRARICDFRTVNGIASLAVLGKGHVDRDQKVRIPQRTEAAIREYLAARGESDPDAPLFASHSNRNATGKPLNTKSISRLVKPHLDRIREPGQNISCHSLRHTAAFTALRHGTPIEEVRIMLRHKSITVTQTYVDHLAFETRQGETTVENAILG